MGSSPKRLLLIYFTCEIISEYYIQVRNKKYAINKEIRDYHQHLDCEAPKHWSKLYYWNRIIV